MTDITQNADTYPPAIYQISVTDPVLGGAGGIANKAAAALADRTAYQRMRNVTPWVPGLDQPYPAHAYVQRLGLTYKSLVASANIDPATPAAAGIWERWALTQFELDAYMATFLPYGAPAVCPSTGPIGTDVKAKIFKSALGEYWMWLGDAWRVVAGYYGVTVLSGTQTTFGGGVALHTQTVPRSGYISVSGSAAVAAIGSGFAGPAFAIAIASFEVAHATDQFVAAAANFAYKVSCAKARVQVVAGDVITWTIAPSAASTNSGKTTLSNFAYQYVE